eukprot:75548-Rhodomonas_salina.1
MEPRRKNEVIEMMYMYVIIGHHETTQSATIPLLQGPSSSSVVFSTCCYAAAQAAVQHRHHPVSSFADRWKVRVRVTNWVCRCCKYSGFIQVFKDGRLCASVLFKYSKMDAFAPALTITDRWK